MSHIGEATVRIRPDTSGMADEMERLRILFQELADACEKYVRSRPEDLGEPDGLRAV